MEKSYTVHMYICPALSTRDLASFEIITPCIRGVRDCMNSRELCCNNPSTDNRLLSLQMNVPLYGVLGAAAILLAYILGIETVAKLLVCLLALILG